MNPLLTVIINSYNYASFLPDAIDSVVNQPYRDLELLIIEDGSSDESPEIVRSYAARYPFIRVVDHEENRGLFFTIEEGITLAKGEYLHWLSADDKRCPDFFVKTMHYLKKYPEIPICCSNNGTFSEDQPMRACRLLDVDAPCVIQAEKLPSVMAKSNFWIPGHTMIVKKETLIKHGKYDQRIDFLSDWYLLHDIALREGVVYIPETLALLRIHSKAFSSKESSNRKSVYFQLLEKLKKNGETCSLFKRSTLLQPIIREIFWDILWKPRYWHFLPSFVRKWFYWRLGV